MATVLKENIAKTYRAEVCSCSFLLCGFFSLIVIIVPFFLAASTNGFWIQSDKYTDQASVFFRGEILLSVLTESKTVSSSNTIISTMNTKYYSSVGVLNELNSLTMMPVNIQSTYWDYNYDYKPDLYDFNITLYISPSQVRNIKVFTNFDYRLRNRVTLDMVSMAVADVNVAKGVSTLYLDGILNLKQKNPLPCSKKIRTTYNSTLLNNSFSSQNFFSELFLKYNSRNESTFYNYQANILPQGRTDSVLINMKIRIPPNEHIWYIPLFLENLKFAWIQYLSLLLPLGYLILLCAGYIFSQQIFDSVVDIKY